MLNGILPETIRERKSKLEVCPYNSDCQSKTNPNCRKQESCLVYQFYLNSEVRR